MSDEQERIKALEAIAKSFADAYDALVDAEIRGKLQ